MRCDMLRPEPPIKADTMEQAVIVHLPLRDGEFGSSDEQEAALALAEELGDAIASASAGEYDGEEFGGGRCVLYMYGPDADRLFMTIEPVLKRSEASRGGFAIKRYGEAADISAVEERVAL